MTQESVLLDAQTTAPAADLPAQDTPETEIETIGTEQPEGQATDETEEIEVNGKQYRVHRDLKGSILMHQDYTKKTQEVAEQRKAIEAAQKTWNERLATVDKVQEDQVNLRLINMALQDYTDPQRWNWDKQSQDDPAGTVQHLSRFNMLKEQRDALVQRIQQQSERLALEAKQEHAKRIEESRQAVAREIPGWSQELAVKLEKFAADVGVPADRIAGISTATEVKILHWAMLGKQMLDKQRQATQTVVPAATPVPQVGTRAAPVRTGPTDRQSVDQWMKEREKQVRGR